MSPFTDISYAHVSAVRFHREGDWLLDGGFKMWASASFFDFYHYYLPTPSEFARVYISVSEEEHMSCHDDKLAREFRNRDLERKGGVKYVNT